MPTNRAMRVRVDQRCAYLTSHLPRIDTERDLGCYFSCQIQRVRETLPEPRILPLFNVA